MGRRTIEIDQATVLVLTRQVRTADPKFVRENGVALRERARFVPASAGGKVRRDERW
ncbi:hypothetical protein [Streptomyces gibsoniae]|uniref:Uncharacterized protein n=1 Tax=Streptomyces gibsoniae TaxID=3075529 RepID=A0ABU2TVL1_9ACTN|nr:hypothetical protein [Streptomyces sp. DSM 41699]MDT0464862.1 hypothetical protein [Streptomyces sp. DSM 41699]